MGRNIFLVGIGGLLGTIFRYLVSLFFTSYVNSLFPYATFVVNVLGCFLIGVLFAVSDRGELLSPEWRLFLATGFCGGFTTFSAYSIESVRLLQTGEFFYAFANVILSVAAGLLATWLGIIFVRSV